MDTTENLQTQFNDLLRQKSGRRQAVPVERMLFAEQEAPMSVESVPVPQPETSPGRRFSIFDLEQAKQASALAAELMGIADNAGGGTVGQQKALAAANARMLTENVELVQY